MTNEVNKSVIKKILVVEDDESTREAVLLKFKTLGIETDFAVDGIEGLEKLRQNGPFSGILLDLQLPRGDGFIFMEGKNDDSKVSDIPVIVFSNFSQPEFINHALNLGARAYLIKTQHSIDEIVELVRKCLEEDQCQIDR